MIDVTEATEVQLSAAPGANEAVVRNLYQIAEVKDGAGFAALFAPDGVFIDEGFGHAYRGAAELARSVEVYSTAMPDMHRELYNVFPSGDRIIVGLSLNGTSLGPLEVPGFAAVPPTGKRVKAPCCDVFQLRGGKVVSFHCYQEIR